MYSHTLMILLCKVIQLTCFRAATVIKPSSYFLLCLAYNTETGLCRRLTCKGCLGGVCQWQRLAWLMAHIASPHMGFAGGVASELTPPRVIIDATPHHDVALEPPWLMNGFVSIAHAWPAAQHANADAALPLLDLAHEHNIGLLTDLEKLTKQSLHLCM